MNYLDKLQSRKFQLAIGSILMSLGGALSGQMDWTQAIIAIVVTSLAYMGVEGAVDVAYARKEETPVNKEG